MVDMNDTFGIWSNGMDSRVKDEASNINTKASWASMNELTL